MSSSLKRTTTWDSYTREHTVEKVIVKCNATGISASSRNGITDGGVKRALAKLSDRCTCGNDWHFAKSYNSSDDSDYSDDSDDW